jgi:protein required for attachment to host cells
MMKPVRTWILIANGARAHVLQNNGPGKGIKQVAGCDYRTSHEADREIQADRPGRTHDRVGSGRHALEATSSPHRIDKDEFAGVLMDELERKFNAGQFDRLLIVAPPRTLGDLRHHMPNLLKSCLVGSVHKDLTHVPNDAIAPHLEGVLAL